MSLTADSTPRCIIVLDEVRTSSLDFFGCLSSYQWEGSLRPKLLEAGFRLDSVSVLTLSAIQTRPDLLDGSNLIVGLGEAPLRFFTGKKSIDKFHLSPLETHCGRKFIGSFGFDRLQGQYELNLYLKLTLRRAFEEFSLPLPYRRAPERFLLNPDLETTFETLRALESADEIAVDVETGYGQINTVGFAWSESDAIAINVLPDRCADDTYYELWNAIARVLQRGSRKVFQNHLYDVSYFSAYGVRVGGDVFDTMWAMKVLWPELDMGLGNVGRIYTDRPYWKDDGKVEAEEGKKKDWGNVRDWVKHYTYNCRDTTGTWEAHRRQRADLESRDLDSFFRDSVQSLSRPLLEMCGNGFPLDLERREVLRAETEARISELTSRLHSEVGRELNPRSPKQKMDYVKSLGVKLPKKYDKEKGVYRETADSAALRKILLSRPDLSALRTLGDIASLDKALSSYINFDVREGDPSVRYSLGKFTETLRLAGGTDPWDRGFNIQTIPREGGDVSIKSMLAAPEGWSFVEVDLRQAESRFVAYRAPEPKLIEMLESGEDVHKHVAYEILKGLGKPASEYSKDWRQLGKKSGHGANYMMKAQTFVDSCFNEMDVVLTKKEAQVILDAYYNLFPGIPRWHKEIDGLLYRTRKLTAPTGWVRYFYGRPGSDMLREAVAWEPQHTIPWILRKLMFYLIELRRCGILRFRLLSETHDALKFLVEDQWVSHLADACHRLKDWHPKVELPGGLLVIPVEVQHGKRLSEMVEYGK